MVTNRDMTDSCTRNFIHTIGIVKIEIEVDEVGVSLVGSEMSCWSLFQFTLSDQSLKPVTLDRKGNMGS